MNNLPTLDDLNKLLDRINDDVKVITKFNTNDNFLNVDYLEVCRTFQAQKLVIEAIECHYYEDQD